MNFFTIYKIYLLWVLRIYIVFLFNIPIFFFNMNQVSINLQVLIKFLVAETFYSMPNYCKPILIRGNFISRLPVTADKLVRGD